MLHKEHLKLFSCLRNGKRILNGWMEINYIRGGHCAVGN
jgi:hypothetical protein